MKVQAVKHTDVRNKTLFYLKFNTSKTELLINVGQKTYESILAMGMEDDIPELPLEETENNGTEMGNEDIQSGRRDRRGIK